MAVAEMEYMEDYGGIDIHDLLNRVDDPHFLAVRSHPTAGTQQGMHTLGLHPQGMVCGCQ